MKKNLVASLAAAMVLSVAGTSFAATNPFADVPAKHWSYDAVTKLAKAGIVDGYGDGTFRGDKVMSRYEMAQITAKAMAHSDKATAEQKAAIDKLSVEFASELEGLNVRVTSLEKNSSTIKVSGEARVRYENMSANTDASGNSNLSNNFKLRTRVNLDGTIDDQWSYYGRLQSENNLRGDKDTSVTMDNAYVKGQLLGATATIGRFDLVQNYGLMYDSTLNGVNFAFGNVVKANVFYGKDNNDDVWGNDKNTTKWNQHLTVTGLGLKYPISKATSVNGSYYQFEDKDKTGLLSKVTGNSDDKAKVWELGVKTSFAPDWTLSGAYGKSDADVENKAYYAEVAYKGADKNKVGSYGAWVNYRHLEAFAAPKTTFDGPYAYNAQLNGGKGYEIGFNYTPMLNTVLRVKYADLKATTEGARSDKTKFFQAQAEFFF